MNGLSKTYYENGQIEYRAEMKNGVQDGLTKTFDENGKVTGQSSFENGELIK